MVVQLHHKLCQRLGISTIKKLTAKKKKSESKKRKKKDNGITVKGLDNILVRFAKCCNPLPGDDIIGYITKGRGVAIHRKDCPNIKLDDEFLKNRLVEVEWNNPEKSKFEGEVKIIAIDRVGLLNDVIHIVSMEKLRISGINCRVLKDNTAKISIMMMRGHKSMRLI